MKKLLTLIMLAVFAISASAQKLEGTYIANDDFNDLIESDIDEDGIIVGLSMFFKGDAVNLIVIFDSIDEEMTFTCGFTYLGKFTKTGNTYKCEFDKNNVAFSILNLECEDPEILEALSDTETKMQIYKKLEESLKETMKPQMQKLSVICDDFSSFSIKYLTYDGYTLVLLHDDEKMEIEFDKL